MVGVTTHIELYYGVIALGRLGTTALDKGLSALRPGAHIQVSTCCSCSTEERDSHKT